MIKKKCKECGTLLNPYAPEYCDVCHGNYGWWFTCDSHQDIIFRGELEECPVCKAEKGVRKETSFVTGEVSSIKSSSKDYGKLQQEKSGQNIPPVIQEESKGYKLNRLKERDIESHGSLLTPLNELRGNVVFNIARVGLMIQLLLAGLMIIFSFMQIDVLDKMDSGYYQSESTMMEAANANDSRAAVMAIIWIIVYVTTGILVLMWIFKAHKNALRYGIKKKFSAGWAVGSFFVPIISLLRPYQAMKELHLCSEYPISWQNEKTGVIFPIWWTLWLVTNFIDQFLLKWYMNVSDPSINQLIEHTYLDIASDVLSVITTFIFLKIIGTIHQNQKFQYLA